MTYITTNLVSNPWISGVWCSCCPPLPGTRAAFAVHEAAAKRAAASSKASAKSKAKAKAKRAPAKSSPRRIDVHHHIAPAVYVKAMESLGLAGENHWQNEVYKGWSPAAAVETMDEGGTQTAITTITSGTAIAAHPHRVRIARECNEYAANLKRDYPGRFGHFATLPMPDVKAALREIDYALDVLKLDGVDMRTSYGNQYLGDPAFAPIYEELNRRKAIVYSHPHEPRNLQSPIPGVPGSTIEFCTDTTRAIASVVFGGTSSRYPGVRFIFSHGGGTLPFIVERFTRLAARGDFKKLFPKGVLPELQRFYYEVAQAAHPGALSSLTRLVKVNQILFGTDFPYRTSKEIGRQLVEYGFGAAELAAINHDNAAKLFPQFK
ncbi:MAG: amidohydrolase family protein [Burkholderiales bacterium]